MSVEPRYRRIFLFDEEGKAYTLLNPLPVEATTTTGDFVFDVDDNNIAKDQVPQTTNGLNYGYEDTEGHWTRMLTEYDNDDIPAGQRPQLVNGLMYYYDDKIGAWNRWRGDAGSLWTYVVNFPDTDYVDDGVFTVGSNRGVAIGGVATSDSVNPNDFGVFRITTDRSLVVTNDNITDGSQKTQLVDSSGNIILSDDERLKVETTITGRTNSERHAWINPTNEQAVSPVYRMIGTNFDGDTKDTNFWTELVDAGTDGSVTQANGVIDLKTSATATGWAKYTSVRKSRFVAGSAQLFEGGFNFKTAATEDNIRRVGAYTTTDTVNTPVDGFYFELDNTTFSVNSRNGGGTVSSVASGSFNGEYGVTWTPTADTYYKLSIEWSPMGAFFYVNGKLLHKKQGANQSAYMTLPITIENIYTSGSVDVSFETVGMYIARQGELRTNPTSYYHAYGSTTGVTLKQGAGTIHTIIFGSAANNAVVTISDSTTTDTPVLWEYDATGALSVPVSIDMGNLPFSDGLRLTITNSASCTIVYE